MKSPLGGWIESDARKQALHGRYARTYGSGMVHVYESAEALKVLPPNSVESLY